MTRAEPRRRARGKRRSDSVSTRTYAEPGSPAKGSQHRLEATQPAHTEPFSARHLSAFFGESGQGETAAGTPPVAGKRIRTDVSAGRPPTWADLSASTEPLDADPVRRREPATTPPGRRPTPGEPTPGEPTPGRSTPPRSTSGRQPARASSSGGRVAPRVAEPARDGFHLGRFAATLLWSVLIAAGIALLGLAVVGGSMLDQLGTVAGPRIVSGVGAAIVSTCYVWGIAGRAGGRPVLFSALAAAIAAAVLITDDDRLRTGAAVMTAAVAAIFAVMSTVPARRFGGAVRECLIATLIAVVGGFAALGWDPVLTVARFQYAALAVALVGVFAFVYRLGAGLHGLGRRGVLVVAIGVVMLAGTLLYAEMIRRYGTPGLVDALDRGIAWSRVHLHGYPRPIESLVGVPALLWGIHMRARRRQGWWVTAFGVAVTAPIASTLVNPGLGVVTQAVSLCYSLVVGLVIGLIVIRIDLLLTPSAVGRTSAGGRRAAREAEDATAVRPEPRRTQALL